MWLLAWNKTIEIVQLTCGFYALSWPRRGARISSLYSPRQKYLSEKRKTSHVWLYINTLLSGVFNSHFPLLVFFCFDRRECVITKSCLCRNQAASSAKWSRFLSPGPRSKKRSSTLGKPGGHNHMTFEVSWEFEGLWKRIVTKLAHRSGVPNNTFFRIEVLLAKTPF